MTIKNSQLGLLPVSSASSVWACGLFVLATACSGEPAAPPVERPNVLFIAVDDLNVALGTYGEYPTAKTHKR